jgi:SAM-dependent methyltransferase
MTEAQSFSVKRAEVEFHAFAALGEPERALGKYLTENQRRGAILRNHLGFVGPMSPFLEIGAAIGHTSYMLANEFGADGFALDLSADALRYGGVLQEMWGLARAPVRIAGDAVRLPFQDNSLRFVVACQMLSQFMNIESVFLEVKRVLAPGGVFLFTEEPLRRMLSLRLYRAPYWEQMKPWERRLSEWGLLGYLVRDVIGAHQEESFGIRQNHTMGLKDWHALVQKHFVAHEYEIFVPERGWGERVVKQAAIRLDRHGSVWRAARLLGGTLSAFCRKAGETTAELPGLDRFEECLQCPDCRGTIRRDPDETLRCMQCGYLAANEGGVYNVLASADRKELYPGDREDILDFSQPGHARGLGPGWYDVEGVYGNRYRWMGARAEATLRRVHEIPHRIRVRGFAQEALLKQGKPARIEVRVNGDAVGQWTLERVGLFVLEADVPDAAEYRVEILGSPTWSMPPDERVFSINVSMIRLVPRES